MVRRKSYNENRAGNRVAVYARFSCDKQRDASIEDQVYEAERYCERMAYEIVKVYPDYAISGRSDDRPQFLQMIEDAQKGAFDIVLVWKMDRFARNMQDQFFHEKILNDCGVQIESIKENIAGNGIEASLSKGMHAIFAQIRSQQSAEDTMRGMLGKARKCQYLGYKWYGYSHDGDVITLDPIEAPIAEEIHMRYLAGDSIKEILEWLKGQGVKTSQGKTPGYCFINNMLKSWRYAGVYTWGFEKDARGNKILDASGDPIPLVNVPGGMPAIVSESVKERCIKKLEFGKHEKAKANYLLSGKMFCSACGNAMRGEVCKNHAGVEYYRYTCQKKRKACLGVFWKDETEEAVTRSVRNAFKSRETLELIAEKFAEYRSGKKPKASIEAAKKDLKALIKQRDNLIKAVEDGMPYKHVRDKMEEIDRQQSEIEAKIAELEHEESEISKAEVLDMLICIADGMRSSAEVIDAFVSEVWLYESAAVAVMSFNGRDGTTKHEIDCYMKTSEPAGHELVRMNRLWLPTGEDIRTRKPQIVIAEGNTPVILLESGIGIIAPLKAA